MTSKWYEYKSQAIKLRRKGYSLRRIAKDLEMPKSTLSGWLKSVILSEDQLKRLQENSLKNLIKARKKAVVWHNNQKNLRIQEAEQRALTAFTKINFNDPRIQELALAMLYLGEGGKTKSGTLLGSSDPLILKFFLLNLLKNYQIKMDNIKCSLHLRADQDIAKLTKYWAKELGIPIKNFTKPSVDLRSQGRVTYTTYNGVCVISCGNIALQRKLIFLSRIFCEKVALKMGS